MTHATKHTRWSALPAAGLAALLLAGCSTGHIGESWQCPLAEGGSCDSVAAADPAVPKAGAVRASALTEPLWRVRGGDADTLSPEAAAACEADCAGFDPFAWLVGLFDAETADGEKTAAPGPVRLVPPEAPAPAALRPNRKRPRHRRATKTGPPAISAPAKSSRASGSRPSWTPAASTARRPGFAWCWNRPAGGSSDPPPAGAVRGSGGAGSLDAARDAGGAPFAAAVARLRRIERALRQRGLHRLRGRAAALRGDRRGDPGGARGHARRRGARAMHHTGDPLGEPALWGGAQGLGRAAGRDFRRRARPDGCGPSRAAGARRLAAAARRRPALHAVRLPGNRDRVPGGWTRPGLGDRARRVPPGIGGDARLGRGRDAAPRSRRADLARRRADRARHRRIPRRRNGAPAAPLVAARSDPRAVHRARPGVDGPSHRPRLPPRWITPVPRRRRRRRAGAECRRLPRGLAGLARQRADRRFPPRFLAARLPRPDLPHRHDRRRGGRASGRSSRARERPSRPAPASPATCPACPRRRATGRPSPSA